MPFPVTIPFAFGARTGNVAASELDTDFNTLAAACNDLKALIDAIVGGNVSGTGTPDQLAYWIGSNTIGSTPGLQILGGGSELALAPGGAFRLPTSNLAGVPPSAVQGRLRYLTDGARGIIEDSGTAAGWISSHGNVYNVQRFGAKGLGDTDDRAACQAALDEAGSNAGAMVYFPGPPGVYVIGDPGLVIPPYTTVCGPGPGGAAIMRGGAYGPPLLHAPNPWNVYIRDLRLDGGGFTGDLVKIGPTTMPNPLNGGFAYHTGFVQNCTFRGTPKSAVDNSAYFWMDHTAAAGGDPVLFGVLQCEFDAGAYQVVVSDTCVGPLYMQSCFMWNFGRNAIYITGNFSGNSLLAFNSAIISTNSGLVNILCENSTQLHWRNGYCEGAIIGIDLAGNCADIRIQDSFKVGNIRFRSLFGGQTFNNVVIKDNDDVYPLVSAFTPGGLPMFWSGNHYATGAAPSRSALPTAFVVKGNIAGNYSEDPQSATANISINVGPGGGFTNLMTQDFTLHRADGGVRIQAFCYGTGATEAVAGSIRIRAGAPGAEVLQSPDNPLNDFKTAVNRTDESALDVTAAAWGGGTFRVIVEAQETGGASLVNFFRVRLTVTPF